MDDHAFEARFDSAVAAEMRAAARARAEQARLQGWIASLAAVQRRAAAREDAELRRLRGGRP